MSSNAEPIVAGNDSDQIAGAPEVEPVVAAAPEPKVAPEEQVEAKAAAEPVIELAPEPEPAPAPEPAPEQPPIMPEITDRMVRTKRSRAKALAVTKELHRAGVSDETAIRFDHVTKTYNLYRNDWARFLGLLNIKKKRTGFIGTINANDDLSFEIKRGEAVAFLGLNGAGKSTALKMITGVTYPTKGEITVNGRVSALLELSAGFDAQLTGRENIHLRGQILGISDEELEEIEPRAIEFAELGMYIDQPMRSYSSGMKARLGFSLAVFIKPEILVVDEALSVGDRPFKKKCIERIREIMMDEKVTVLFVTHSTTTAQEFCSRGLVLDHGKKKFDGSMEDAMAYYEANY